MIESLVNIAYACTIFVGYNSWFYVGDISSTNRAIQVFVNAAQPMLSKVIC